MKVTKLLHTRMRVSDLDQTIQFYTTVLGLDVIERKTSPRGSQLAFLKVPNSDELIELIHLLKADAGAFVRPPTITLLDPSLQASLSAGYDARMKAKTEAQRLLLQALVELAKEIEKPGLRPNAHHSSNPPIDF